MTSRHARVRLVQENRKHFRGLRRAFRYLDAVVFLEDVRTLPPPPEEKDVARAASILTVTPQDTLVAAEEMVAAGQRPLVHNMASDVHMGGGYLKGARAQEEELMLRTTLELSLASQRHRYPLGAYQGFYSPHVVVFRDQHYRLLSEPYEIGVVTLAALRQPGPSYTPSQREIMATKIVALFHLASQQGHDALLLSAFGCGAFRNPPAEVARLFRHACATFEGVLHEVRFAIHDERGENFRVFREALAPERQ